MKKTGMLAAVLLSISILVVPLAHSGYLGIGGHTDANFSDGKNNYSSRSGMSVEGAMEIPFLNFGLELSHFQNNFQLNSFSPFIKLNLGFPGIAGVYWRWGRGISEFRSNDQRFTEKLTKNGFGAYYRVHQRIWLYLETAKWDGPRFINFKTYSAGLQYQF